MRRDRRLTRRAFCKGIAAGAAACSALPGCGALPHWFAGAQPLATDWQQRRERYNFAIIGSGYGGSIMAARLSAADVGSSPSVCILERGEEWPAGTFPDTWPGVLKAMRVPLANPLGLYEFRPSQDMTVVQGCGLGGTSLINAAVALVPDAEVFESDCWPAAVTLDVLQPFYQLARQMLAARPHPRVQEFLKAQALQVRAEQIGLQAQALDLAVNFDIDGVNANGVTQSPCIDCGDCFPGCNVGAKNTLAVNYLPAARANGAHIFARTEVEWIEHRVDGTWRVHGRRYELIGPPRDFVLDADNVVLSAGSLGSAEILLRSRERGLSLSDQLGEGFSGNGDFFGVAFNGDAQTNVLGFGNHPNHPWRRNAPGTAITAGIYYHADRPIAERFVVQDMDAPTALIRQAMLFFGAVGGEDMDQGDELEEWRRLARDRPAFPYVENSALNHSMAYVAVGHDSAAGRIRLNGCGQAEVAWDQAGEQAVFKTINAEIREHARAQGAHFVSNPFWGLWNAHSLFTAHPLGGCRMADSHELGVVDEFGRAYTADGALHAGLYVADASVIPEALGVNPLLTISALCERMAAFLIDSL